MSQLTLEHILVDPVSFRGPREVCRGMYLKRPGNFLALFVETSKVRIRKKNAFL